VILALSLMSAPAFAQTPGPCRSALRMGGRPDTIDSISSVDFPIKVHWNRPQDAAKAQLVLDYAELSWQVQIDELGFRAPPLPDDAHGPELDYYLSNVGAGEAYAEVADWDDQVDGDNYNSATSYMVIDQNLNDAWIPSYIAHEFNHVLQWGTDFSEPTLPIWEGVAVAAQDWTLGYDEGHWELDVDSFQEAPWLPSLTGDSYESWYRWGVGYFYEYGTALWVMHLDEVVGTGDGTAGSRLWDNASQEGMPNEPDAVDAFATTAGVALGTALNDLARTRWLVGPEWDDRGLAEARNWEGAQMVPVEGFTAADLPLVDFKFDSRPMITGQAFVEVDDLDTTDTLVAQVSSEDALGSGILVLWWAVDGSVGEVQGHGGDPVVELPLQDIERIVVAVTNLGPPGWDGDDNAYLRGDQRLQLSVVVSSTTPTDPSATDSSPSGKRGSAERGGCGCDSGSLPTLWWMVALVFAMHRSRR